MGNEIFGHYPSPDKQENVLCASYILRAGIGSKVPERLQLAMARYLLQVASSPEKYRLGARRCSFIELQHLIAVLAEGFVSLKDSCILACDLNMTPASDLETALLHESNATLRALVIAVPEAASLAAGRWLEVLMTAQAESEKIRLPSLALCAIIRGVASINKGGSIPATHLFAMAKALASRHLDQDFDPSGKFGTAGGI